MKEEEVEEEEEVKTGNLVSLFFLTPFQEEGICYS